MASRVRYVPADRHLLPDAAGRGPGGVGLLPHPHDSGFAVCHTVTCTAATWPRLPARHCPRAPAAKASCPDPGTRPLPAVGRAPHWGVLSSSPDCSPLSPCSSQPVLLRGRPGQTWPFTCEDPICPGLCGGSKGWGQAVRSPAGSPVARLFCCFLIIGLKGNKSEAGTGDLIHRFGKDCCPELSARVGGHAGGQGHWVPVAAAFALLGHQAENKKI